MMERGRKPPGIPDTMKDTSMKSISVNDLAALGPEASMGGITSGTATATLFLRLTYAGAGSFPGNP